MHDLKLSNTQSLQQAYERIQGLQHVTSELSKAITKNHVANIIINEGFKVLGADSGDVAMIDESNQPLVVAYKGYPKSFFNELPNIVRIDPPLLTLQVMRTKKPYFITSVDSVSDEYRLAKQFLQQVKAKSAALLPLQVENEVVGVLEFSFKKEQKFPDEDKEFMMTLAQQCAQSFERVIAQEKLAESKKELEIILSTVADGILVQDEKGNIIYVNEAVRNVFKQFDIEKSFQLPWEEFLNLFEITDEKGNILTHDMMPGRRAVASNKKIKVTYKFTHKLTHESHWLQIESSPIIGVDKKSSISVNVFQDISALKEIEQRKDDFISMASHELKTPLTSAKVFIHVLRGKIKNQKDKDTLRLVEKIDRQLDQLNDLTKDLLDITKLQKGKLEMTKSRFALHKLVTDVVEDLQPSTDHPIRILSLPPSQMFADKEKISQVLTNFITNAIKYSHDSTTIDIHVRKNVKDITVSVKDFGIGISKEDIDKIFERFYRIEKDKKTYPGLGLGLYISSEIIKQHGGKIWVKSEKGKGSTFYFSLPI